MTLTQWSDGDVDPPTEFRVGMKTRFFNWSLDRAIRAKGWTRNQAAAELGIGVPALYKWLAFRNYPRAGKALEVAVVLGVSDEILFPEEIKGFRITKQPEPISFGRDEALELGMFSQDVDPEELAIQGGLTDGINKAMQSIREREKLVLTQRFGLDGGDAKTLDQVAAILGVTRERIRQIEAKALRKLRHPSRALNLRDYVTEERWAATTGRAMKVMAEYAAEAGMAKEELKRIKEMRSMRTGDFERQLVQMVMEKNDALNDAFWTRRIRASQRQERRRNYESIQGTHGNDG